MRLVCLWLCPHFQMDSGMRTDACFPLTPSAQRGMGIADLGVTFDGLQYFHLSQCPIHLD